MDSGAICLRRDYFFVAGWIGAPFGAGSGCTFAFYYMYLAEAPLFSCGGMICLRRCLLVFDAIYLFDAIWAGCYLTVVADHLHHSSPLDRQTDSGDNEEQ